MWSGILSALGNALPSLLSGLGGWVKSLLGENKAANLSVLQYKDAQRRQDDELEKKLLRTKRNKKQLENDPRQRD